MMRSAHFRASPLPPRATCQHIEADGLSRRCHVTGIQRHAFARAARGRIAAPRQERFVMHALFEAITAAQADLAPLAFRRSSQLKASYSSRRPPCMLYAIYLPRHEAAARLIGLRAAPSFAACARKMHALPGLSFICFQRCAPA